MSLNQRILDVIRENAALRARVEQLLTLLKAADFDASQVQESIEKATQAAVSEILDKLSGLEVPDLRDRLDANEELQRLRDELGNQKFVFELFHSYNTVMDAFRLPVLHGVRGDDSLDVADPMQVEYDKVYLLSDGVHAEEVMLRSRHEDGRIRITTNLQYSYGTDATLSRTTAFVDSALNAVRGPGYYMTKALEFARHGLVYAEYEGAPPTLEIASASGGGAAEAFTAVSGTVQRSGLISFPFGAGKWIFRFGLTAAAVIKRLIWVDQGEVSEFLARIEIEDESGLYRFRFAEFGLPETRDYVVQLTPDADYRVAARNRSANGFDIQLYMADGRPGAIIDTGLIFCGAEGAYCGAGLHCGEESELGDPIGPAVDLTIRFADAVLRGTPYAATGDSDGNTQSLPRGTLLVLGSGVYPLLSGGQLLAGGA